MEHGVEQCCGTDYPTEAGKESRDPELNPEGDSPVQNTNNEQLPSAMSSSEFKEVPEKGEVNK